MRNDNNQVDYTFQFLKDALRKYLEYDINKKIDESKSKFIKSVYIVSVKNQGFCA
jgi:hypothetical protein